MRERLNKGLFSWSLSKGGSMREQESEQIVKKKQIRKETEKKALESKEESRK
jgi:hypothetical protein